MNTIQPVHFALFRISIGAYLLVHFAWLLPYATEIWGPHGVIADPSLNLTHGILPNPLAIVNTDALAWGTVLFGALLSALLITGWQRPIVSLILWFCWACLLDRNNLIANPGIPFVGWLLLVLAVVPRGEPWTLPSTRRRADWQFPVLMHRAAWVIMAVAYSISGVDKWGSPSWRDGTAITHLLENPLARDTNLRVLLLGLPDAVHSAMTWSILAMELLFAPLCLFAVTRKWAWLLMVGMHLGILCIVDFADLTLGMLMIHLFTFDPAWIPDRWKRIIGARWAAQAPSTT